MDIYLKLFEVLFPVFFIVGIGYFLGKKNPKLDTSFITNFAANIGTPAMVFYSITTTGITFEIFTNYFWYALLAISGFALTRFKVFSFQSALIASISRVIIGPVIGFLIIKFFNLSGFAAGVLLIQCSMPSAVLTYLVGSMYSPKKIAV